MVNIWSETTMTEKGMEQDTGTDKDKDERSCQVDSLNISIQTCQRLSLPIWCWVKVVDHSGIFWLVLSHITPATLEKKIKKSCSTKCYAKTKQWWSDNSEWWKWIDEVRTNGSIKKTWGLIKSLCNFDSPH